MKFTKKENEKKQRKRHRRIKAKKLKLKRILPYLGIYMLALMILSLFIDLKIILVVFLPIILLYGVILYKRKVGQELVIAFLISLAWVSYFHYKYTGLNLSIGQINLFPLVLWTFGLVSIREIYKRLKEQRFLKITGIYLAGLFLIEYIGYWVLNIRLDADYPSLLNMGIIHAPIGVKVFYILIGPVYILLTDYLKTK
jgi:hypothetical protein